MLQIKISNDISHSDYSIAANDVLTFTVKKDVLDRGLVFQKKITGSNTLNIVPSDTKSMRFGIYVYDVQLTTASGDIYTIIEPSKFEIMPEVSD